MAPRRRLVPTAFFALCALAVVLLGGTPANAALNALSSPQAALKSGPVLGIVPPHGAHAAAPAVSAASPTLLSYHLGPVMHTNQTYTIFWDPSNQMSASYKSLINGYFANVAAGSGATSNVYGTDTQYTDGSGAISYSSSVGGTWTDSTTPIPTTCVGDYSPSDYPNITKCVDMTDETTEIEHAMTVNGWTGSPTKMFFLFTPHNVGSCADSVGDCAYTVYCAYHSNFIDSHSTDVIWANHPDPLPTDEPFGPPCNVGEAPNNDLAADASINLVSHEHNEAITDPRGNAWWDSTTGDENGDKCAWTFGTALGTSNGSFYNQAIGTGKYELQQEWSNFGAKCSLVGIHSASLTNVSPSSGEVGTTVTLTGTGFTGATSVKFNGVADTSYSVDSDTQITAHVPNGAKTGRIVVVSPTGTATSAANFGVPPTITEPFSPTEGMTGTVVTLGGAAFTNTSHVTVGGVAASFSVLSYSTLRFTIPGGAVSGTIAVTNPGGTTVTGGSFTVDPKLTGMTPSSGPFGQTVTLSGSGFGASGATRVVHLNGVTMSVVTWVSPNRLTFVVPAGATTGLVDVQVDGGPIATTTSPFRVTPNVTGFDILSGQVGDAVTIQGSAFYGATAVSFNGVPQPTFVVAGDGASIATTIPAGALSGRVSVTVAGHTFASSASLKIRPTIDEPFAPSEGQTGTVLTLTGQTFRGTSHVTVGGVSASFSVLSPTSLKIAIPAGAVSGVLAVTNAGGTTTTSGSFTVDPKITSLSSNSKAVGGTLAINGSGFGASGESRVVSVNGTPAISVTWVSPTRLTFVVPAGATTGPVTVQVGGGAIASSPGNLTVT